ncbi:Succinate dehydrogenase assembly factor 2 [Diplonema papillatum]|nr:Succinate dehydrogenase assembly factor 2 [Diplonema papillatum]
MFRIASRTAVRCYAVSMKEQGLHNMNIEINHVDYESMDMRQPTAAVKFEADIETARKRLSYQSGKRGMLEMDALLGTYGKANIPTWSVDELKQWNDILRQYDNDLYCWLVRKTKMDTIPDDLKASPLFKELIKFADDRDKPMTALYD